MNRAENNRNIRKKQSQPGYNTHRKQQSGYGLIPQNCRFFTKK
jgi:hypothetical protein